MRITVNSVAEADEWLSSIRAASEKTREWILGHAGDGLSLLKALKFDAVGYHPVGNHNLNAIEQINQTFTYAVAITAAKELLKRHPEANGFMLAPGADMNLPLDIMSVEPGLVGAETFASVDPRNNRKLAKDLAKLEDRTEQFRYVYFSSPVYPGSQRRKELEKHGIQVWSVDV